MSPRGPVRFQQHETGRVRSMGEQLLEQLPLLVALVLLWLFLWGSFTPVDVLMGVFVAILVTRVFELPPVTLSGRFNPFWLIVFLVDFIWHVILGSVQVAALAFRFGRVPKSSVVEVNLETKSDFVMTLVAIATSLVPGSLILEVDREKSTLFLHVINADDPEHIEKARRDVILTERRLLRALGSRDELDRSDARCTAGRTS
ncbi:MAG: Na+/H+ antiporter subunit E [Naasia sp.]